MQFFWFVHSLKSEYFRAIWSLVIFLKIRFFSKKFQNLKIFKIFEKKNVFSRKVTNFKCVYSNQFKRFEYIQGIWEMQNFMKNTMTKKFLARAHYRARAGRLICLLGQHLMIIEFSQQCAVWRAPRAQVRAHPQFFH